MPPQFPLMLSLTSRCICGEWGLKRSRDFMGIISAINWLVTKDNGWLLFPWSGCNGHNLSSFCPARHSWLSIGGEHLVCSGNNLSSAVQWSNGWLCIDTIRHQSVAGPVQQEVTCGEKQIKASDYNSSYLVGFQSVSTEVFSSRSSQGQAGFHWVEPEIVAVIVFNQSSLLTPTIIVIAKPSHTPRVNSHCRVRDKMNCLR